MIGREQGTVLMTPDYTGSNPYQSQLIAALERRGVGVETVDATQRFTLLRGCRRHGVPDVVHLHWVHTFVAADRRVVTALLGARLLVELAVVRLLGADIVWTVHNLLDHERRSPRTELAIRHCVARLSFRLIVHCEAARSSVTERYRLPDSVGDRIHVVPHGNYIDVYENECTQASARRALDLPSEAVVFCFFGLIRPYKNVPELVEAFRELDAEHARLLVAGNPWTDELEARVRDACALDDRVLTALEYVDDDDVQRYVNAADVIVLPFDSVLTSGSALLGMSFGRALIVPRTGCPAERATDVGGILYDTSDPDGLEDALSRALEPDTDLESMGDRNRRVAEQLDWDGIARQVEALYHGRSADSNDVPLLRTPTRE